mmetsp:Transcript_17614/g.41844  ORF Transcript_17614/g.41844 Transcript_17614/m.41844 type:complete len:227 (-) Transcript_17614:520-1200(-)
MFARGVGLLVKCEAALDEGRRVDLGQPAGHEQPWPRHRATRRGREPQAEDLEARDQAGREQSGLAIVVRLAPAGAWLAVEAEHHAGRRGRTGVGLEVLHLADAQRRRLGLHLRPPQLEAAAEGAVAAAQAVADVHGQTLGQTLLEGAVRHRDHLERPELGLHARTQRRTVHPSRHVDLGVECLHDLVVRAAAHGQPQLGRLGGVAARGGIGLRRRLATVEMGRQPQ